MRPFWNNCSATWISPMVGVGKTLTVGVGASVAVAPSVGVDDGRAGEVVMDAPLLVLSGVSEAGAAAVVSGSGVGLMTSTIIVGGAVWHAATSKTNRTITTRRKRIQHLQTKDHQVLYDVEFKARKLHHSGL
jgi:hypothetical protein